MALNLVAIKALWFISSLILFLLFFKMKPLVLAMSLSAGCDRWTCQQLILNRVILVTSSSMGKM